MILIFTALLVNKMRIVHCNFKSNSKPEHIQNQIDFCSIFHGNKHASQRIFFCKERLTWHLVCCRVTFALLYASGAENKTWSYTSHTSFSKKDVTHLAVLKTTVILNIGQGTNLDEANSLIWIRVEQQNQPSLDQEQLAR
jgi:hypothetical protein